MGKAFRNHRIEDRSFVSFIKREIHMEATRAGFSQRRVGEIDIIVSELTSNIIKHAGSGEILYRIVSEFADDPGFEIISIDQGPGMNDPEKMMKDGISTSGTLGQGLGAIRRLSRLSQIYSVPGSGTIIYALVTMKERKSPTAAAGLQVRAVCVSKPREDECGDGYMIKNTDRGLQVLFGDGLGHGAHARAAVDAAAACFQESDEDDPVAMMQLIHERVRRTRGLVASLAFFEKASNQWRICGVGNIMVRVYNGVEFRNYISHNGTVGMNLPGTMKESIFKLEKNQYLIMCTDGLKSRWNLARYTSLTKYDNTILAAALYRDYARGTDDASVLVAKVN